MLWLGASLDGAGGDVADVDGGGGAFIQRSAERKGAREGRLQGCDEGRTAEGKHEVG